MAGKQSDLESHIKRYKKENPDRAESFEEGYKNFKIGVLLRQAREEAGMTQAELAAQIHTQKNNISRLENHAEDVKLSTLEKVAKALGKKLELRIA